MPCYALEGIRPVVHPKSYVHPTATLIGDVIVEAGCYVGPGAVMRGDFGRLILREGANLQDTCVVHGFPGTDTIIERHGHIGHGAVLHGCHIGENALIGMNSVIMDGARIGHSSIVAAMCFVKAGMQVPDRHLVAGTPGRIVRELRDDEIAWKITGTRQYHELSVRSMQSMVETTPLTAMEPDRPRFADGSAIPLHERKQQVQGQGA
ncbi:MAG: phenylacetic acid degradation protein PaaY [Thiothrix sp.]|nr:phenylacetic acid degradation protein PaaY [Thiothrix sp.]HPQ96500.1 DapH/DapD/GlmU-related protein [Thiolinea sp.]